MFRPCIDIHNGKVKQIVGSSIIDNKEKCIVENFISKESPSFYASLFKKHDLKGGHVIMLDQGNERIAVNALNEYPGGLQIGGGITDQNASFFIENGASHVIITSYVFNNGKINYENLKKVLYLIGKDRLVLDLSCRIKDNKYFVVTNRWQKYTEFEVNEENLSVLAEFCDEFLIHSVDVEGKKQGIDIKLIKMLSNWCPIECTYAGGVKSFEDIKLINKIGNNKIHYTIGSSLDIFGGHLSFEDIVSNQLMI